MNIYLLYNLLGNLKSKEAKNNMISFIKTAIITIIITIVSGLLLERCKNWGPKILCDVGKTMPLELGNRKVYAYVITVSNISSKIIHELTLNIHGSHSTIKFRDAKITKGLKFDSSVEDDVLDIYIPYLSKGDKFSVTVYLENSNKPVIAMRSPENFKQIDSKEQKGVLTSLFNISKNSTSHKTIKTNKTTNPNEEDDFTIVMSRVSVSEKVGTKESREGTNKSKKLSKNKKIVLAIGAIVVLVMAGTLVKFGFKEATASKQSPAVKTDVHKSSNGTTESQDKATKSVDTKKSTGGITKNSDSKISTGESNKSTDNKALTGQPTEKTDNKSTTGEASKNTDAKTSTEDTTKNMDTKTSTEDKTKNTDTKPSTGGTTKNSDTNTSTDGITKNTDTKPSANEVTKSGNTPTSTSGTTESKNN